MENLSSDFEENYARFMATAIDCGCIWGLEGPDGWALCPSEKYPESDVMPFWSEPEFAKMHCRDEWAEYNVVPVSIEEFLDDWLPGMHDDVFFVGINWNEDMEGIEIEPLDLLQEFEEGLSQD